jgi:TRAP transporter TAXI family solute receptor
MRRTVGAIIQATALIFGLGTTMALAAPKTFVTIGSGSTTGLYYPTAVGIAKIVNDAGIDVRANARSTGASVFNAKAIGDGQLQMGLMQNNIALYAYKGEGVAAFAGKPITTLRGLATLYPEVVHILARKDSDIKTLADLKDKRVYVGDVGSGTEQDARNIMGAYGVTMDDLKSAIRGSAGDAVNLLRDGRIDAMFYTVGVGAAAIVEAAQTAPVTVIAISPEKIKELHEKYSFYTPITIPGGTYPDLPDAVTTVTLKATLVGSSELPEEAVYELMKTVFHDKLQAFYDDIQNPNLKTYFKVDTALEGMPIPLHPGAVKFYKEEGVSVPAALMPPS